MVCPYHFYGMGMKFYPYGHAFSFVRLVYSIRKKGSEIGEVGSVDELLRVDAKSDGECLYGIPHYSGFRMVRTLT